MTYHNSGRNYRQIGPLTLYEPPKEVNAVSGDIGALRGRGGCPEVAVEAGAHRIT